MRFAHIFCHFTHILIQDCRTILLFRSVCSFTFIHRLPLLNRQTVTHAQTSPTAAKITQSDSGTWIQVDTPMAMCGIMLPAADVTVLNVDCVCVCVFGSLFFNAQLQYSATYMLEIFISVERQTHTSPYMTRNAFFPSGASFKHDQGGGFVLVIYCYFFFFPSQIAPERHITEENVPRH